MQPRHILAMAAVITMMLLPNSALAGVCPAAAKAPKLSLKIQLGDVSLDHGRDLAGMIQVSKALTGYTQGHVPLGITVPQISVHYATAIKFRKVRGGTYCVSLDSAEITVGHSEISVYVSRDYPEGSCEYETVLAHELEHVSISQGIMQAYKDQISKAFERTVQGKPSMLVYRPNEARSAYIRELRLGLKPVLKALVAKQDKENGKIDTKDNYRRLLAKCNNW